MQVQIRSISIRPTRQFVHPDNYLSIVTDGTINRAKRIGPIIDPLHAHAETKYDVATTRSCMTCMSVPCRGVNRSIRSADYRSERERCNKAKAPRPKPEEGGREEARSEEDLRGREGQQARQSRTEAAEAPEEEALSNLTNRAARPPLWLDSWAM